MITIGLTGSLSTGKTTVAEMFKRKSAQILNADKIAHRCIKTDACRSRIIRTFGKDVLRGKNVCRKRLARIVFDSPRKRKKLEQIIHPLVKKEIKTKIAKLRKKKGVLVVEVPLLFESKMQTMMDRVVVIKLKKEIQLKRATKSLKIPNQDAIKRIKAQMPITKKIRQADFIIDNSGTLNQTKKQVDELWLKLQ